MRKVVFAGSENTIDASQASRNRIYAFQSRTSKVVYKAHRVWGVGSYSFAFVACSDCDDVCSAGRHSIEELLRSEHGQDIYEFSSQREFFQWALSVTNG